MKSEAFEVGPDEAGTPPRPARGALLERQGGSHRPDGEPCLAPECPRLEAGQHATREEVRDYHQERADRDGITREEAKAANYRDAYSEPVKSEEVPPAPKVRPVRFLAPGEIERLRRVAVASGSPLKRQDAVYTLARQVRDLQARCRYETHGG